MTVGIGLIGAGGIAGFHARHVRNVPEARLVAICDVVAVRAAELAATYGIPHVEPSIESLLARPDVDAVVVCTPNDNHAPASIAAARAGKHVLCEKPLALTTTEAVAMIEAADAAGICAMVNFSKRPYPAIVQLKALIDAGELGDLLHVGGSYLQSWLLAPSLSGDSGRFVWRLDRRHAGSGALGDLGSHVIDLAHHLVGPIRRVVGTLETKVGAAPIVGEQSTASYAVDDHSTILVSFVSGAAGTIASSRIAAGTRDELTLAVYGTRGAARFDNSRLDHLSVSLGQANLRYSLWSDLHCPLPPGEPLSLDDAFIRAIVAGTSAIPSFRDGLHVQLVMDAVDQSAHSGAWVDIPAHANVP